MTVAGWLGVPTQLLVLGQEEFDGKRVGEVVTNRCKVKARIVDPAELRLWSEHCTAEFDVYRTASGSTAHAGPGKLTEIAQLLRKSNGQRFQPMLGVKLKSAHKLYNRTRGKEIIIAFLGFSGAAQTGTLKFEALVYSRKTKRVYRMGVSELKPDLFLGDDSAMVEEVRAARRSFFDAERDAAGSDESVDTPRSSWRNQQTRSANTPMLVPTKLKTKMMQVGLVVSAHLRMRTRSAAV